jgi:hypothetical protein
MTALPPYYRGTPLEVYVYYTLFISYFILLVSPIILWITKDKFRKMVLQNKENLSFKFLYKYNMYIPHGIVRKFNLCAVILCYFVVGIPLLGILFGSHDFTYVPLINDIIGG